MRRFRLTLAIAFALVLALLLLAGCSGGASSSGTSSGGGSAPSASGTVIDEQNFAFSPTQVTVKVGDTVTFKNSDSAAHRVKVGDTELGNQDPGQSVTWTADKAGTFPVVCVIHPNMKATITVQ